MLTRYEKNATLRALLQLIPFGIGSAADTYITTQLANMRAKRIETFFDELDRLGFELSEEQLQNEDVLHAFLVSMRAVMNARRGDKIRLFARLLNNFARIHVVDNIDEFEEIARVLDDLSPREFQALVLLRDLELKPKQTTDQNDLQRVNIFWDEFLDKMEHIVGIPREEIPGFLERLTRTGLYQTIIGMYLGYQGDRGHTTPNLERLIAAVSEHEL